MSGSAGGNRIPRAVVEKTVQDYIDKVLSKFPGFKKAKITGSYNAGTKQDFGDIDLIVQLEGTDKKLIKQDLSKYFATFPDSIIVPFKSDKYKGKKSLSSGELVTILYPIINTSDQFVQIDNIVSISEEELIFKNSFLDYPAEIQGLLLGLTKVICLEEDPKDIFKRLGINNIPKLEPNQEYEFNLSGVGLTLRIVTLDNFKETDRTDVWKSSDWNTVKKLFINYNIDTDFETLLKDLSTNLKNPRSKNRVKGLFKSMVSVKSGEVGTPKGDNKEKSLQLVDKLLENNYIKNLGEYLVASLLPEEFSNSKKQTIALYPGKFKPPHKGHLEAVKLGLQNADKVIVIISQKQFDKYNDEQSKKIWELYRKALGADASRVEIKISKDPSPIKTAYEVIEEDPINDYLALYGKGEEGRWKALNNKEKYPNAKPFDLGSVESKNIEGQSEVLSSTNLRQAIEDNDRDRIKTFLPYGVDIDQYLNIINDSGEEDIEEIKVNSPIITPEKVWDYLVNYFSKDYDFLKYRFYLEKYGFIRDKSYLSDDGGVGVEGWLKTLPQNELVQFYQDIKQHLKITEIKINNPVIKFPLYVRGKKEWDPIASRLESLGYKWLGDDSLTDWNPYGESWNGENIHDNTIIILNPSGINKHKLVWIVDEDTLAEIKINKPIPNHLNKLLDLQSKIKSTKDLKEKQQYAIQCAELVLPIWDHYYPNDDRPKKAIEATKSGIYNAAAADDAAAAGDAAYADAAYAAADAAYAAVYAADAAADAAYAYAYAYADAADIAANRAISATKTFFKLDEIKINNPTLPVIYDYKNENPYILFNNKKITGSKPIPGGDYYSFFKNSLYKEYKEPEVTKIWSEFLKFIKLFIKIKPPKNYILINKNSIRLITDKNINEVGEGTSQPYKTSSRYSNNEKFIEFSTDSGIDYEISLFHINKFLQVDFHLDTFSDEIYQETNKGELFRIMSTVIKEVKEFLKENKDLEILGIRYVPQEKTKNKGAFLSLNQRNKFYKAFISKIVPGTTYVEQGGIVFAIFPKKENVQENMSDIKNQALYIDKLVNYCCDVLNLKERPKIILVNNNDYSQKHKSFGGYVPGEKKIFVVLKGRNLSDICRSLSHEIKHFEQDLKGVLTPKSGQDGSKHENEANSFSGKIMREFNRKYPEILSISL